MKSYLTVAIIAIVTMGGILVFPLDVAYQQATPDYKNPSIPIDKRVDDLVSRMTLEEKVSQMMNSAAAIERLGIPDYEWWNEGLHGVARAGYATVFPQAIGLAATWDTDLMAQNTQQSLPRRAFFLTQRLTQVSQDQQLMGRATLAESAASNIPSANATWKNHL